MFIVLELFTNLVLETVLYAGAAGVSQVALLISVAFWTWLWGPLGLLMATPLTVCLVVLGKHVPGLAFVGTLMADTPPLAPEYGYYQRLLARDPGEAADLIERHIKNEPRGNRLRRAAAAGAQLRRARSIGGPAVAGRRSGRDRCDARAADRHRGFDSSSATSAGGGSARTGDPARSTRAAARARLCLKRRRRRARPDDARAGGERPADRDRDHQRRGCWRPIWCRWCADRRLSVVCLADLPPSPSSKSRYLVKRLHAAMPELRILVGRWSPAALADESSQALKDAGATLVLTTLAETREYLEGLVEIPRIPAPDVSTDLPTPGSEPQQSLTASA